MVMSFILYVNDILPIENDVGVLSTINIWLVNYFLYEGLGQAGYILRIKLLREHQNKMLGLFKATYIDKILVKFAMHNFKK